MDTRPPTFAPPPAPATTSSGWLKLLIGVGLVLVLLIGGCTGYFFYVGAVGPQTSVYTGNEVPARFLETVRQVGALEKGETIHYFYSDGWLDIKSGFYFVSDRKVAVYHQAAGQKPLQAVPFDEIVSLELYPSESILVDSEITLELRNGQPVSFPVSSEADGDERFFAVIQERVPGAAKGAVEESEAE